MARSFRIYEKKRGHRRTGSHMLGSAGELAFFGALACAGLIGAALFARFLVIPEWRANHEFVETQCRILNSRIGEAEGEDGPVYRPEIQIRYEVGGEVNHVWTYDITNAYSSGRESKQKLLDQFLDKHKNNRTCECWYDPLDPGVVVLVRGYSWWVWLVGLVPAAFILVGGGGVVYTALSWGKSAERRAVITRRVQDVELFGGEPLVRREFPTIPDGGDIINSPGTRAKFRLPMAASPGWPLAITLMACIGWNGIVAVWAAYAVAGIREGSPDWVLIGTLLPFAGVGVGLIVWLIRQFVVATGVGPTHVEISDHPLFPGENYRIFVSQAGRFTIKSINVTLVCEEEATFRQGTNTRTELREVYRQEVFRGEGFEVKRGDPFEAECGCSIPIGAMHSFKSKYNAVIWKLVVVGEIEGWPTVKRSFPVIIQPSGATAVVQSAARSFR